MVGRSLRVQDLGAGLLLINHVKDLEDTVEAADGAEGLWNFIALASDSLQVYKVFPRIESDSLRDDR